jgi:hypothetical protein
MKMNSWKNGLPRRAALAGALLGALVLAGCTGPQSVSSEIATFGDWPAGRAPGSYAFERLPSQQAQAAASDALEATARAALERAGFKPVEDGKEPEVLVQVGARDERTVVTVWDDPLWWHGGYAYGYGYGYTRRGPWLSPRWGADYRWNAYPRYEREVALLIRDRASGKPLFEAHASNDGRSRSDKALFEALFQAALVDFPKLGVNPRRVVVALPPG